MYTNHFQTFFIISVGVALALLIYIAIRVNQLYQAASGGGTPRWPPPPPPPSLKYSFEIVDIKAVPQGAEKGDILTTPAESAGLQVGQIITIVIT